MPPPQRVVSMTSRVWIQITLQRGDPWGWGPPPGAQPCCEYSCMEFVEQASPQGFREHPSPGSRLPVSLSLLPTLRCGLPGSVAQARGSGNSALFQSVLPPPPLHARHLHTHCPPATGAARLTLSLLSRARLRAFPTLPLQPSVPRVASSAPLKTFF